MLDEDVSRNSWVDCREAAFTLRVIFSWLPAETFANRTCPCHLPHRLLTSHSALFELFEFPRHNFLGRFVVVIYYYIRPYTSLVLYLCNYESTSSIFPLFDPCDGAFYIDCISRSQYCNNVRVCLVLFSHVFVRFCVIFLCNNALVYDSLYWNTSCSERARVCHLILWSVHRISDSVQLCC